MKNLITILIVLLSLTTYGQRNIEIHNITHYNPGYITEGNDVTWSEWESCEMEAIFDFDNEVISITNEDRTTLSIIKYWEKTYRLDSDQDTVVVSAFRAYDQNSNIAEVQIHTWLHSNSMQIYLYFERIAITYQIYD